MSATPRDLVILSTFCDHFRAVINAVLDRGRALHEKDDAAADKIAATFPDLISRLRNSTNTRLIQIARDCGADSPERWGLSLCHLIWQLDNGGAFWPDDNPFHDLLELYNPSQEMLDLLRRSVLPPASAPNQIHSASPEGQSPRDDRRSRKKGKVINLRMMEMLNQDPDRVTWTVQKWSEFLGCSLATVHGTQMWKQIQKLRENEKIARQEADCGRRPNQKRAPY